MGVQIVKMEKYGEGGRDEGRKWFTAVERGEGMEWKESEIERCLND